MTGVIVLKGWLTQPVLCKSLPVEDTSQTNIERGVPVSVILSETRFTKELMTIAISFFRMTTIIAALASASWLNFYLLKAATLCFVSGKLLKHISWPFVQVFALFFAQLATIADSVQTLYRYRWIASFFGELDNLLGDNVHCIFGKPGLFSALPLQNTPNRARVLLCLLPLETGASFLVTSPDMFQALTAKELCAFAIGNYSNVIYAPVHTDYGAVGLVNIGNGFGKRYGQIHLAQLDKQTPISHSPVVKVILKLWRRLISNTLDSTLDSGDAQAVFAKAKVPTSNAALQADGRVFEHHRLLGLLFELAQRKIFGRYLARGADKNLRGQDKPGFRFLVSQLVQPGRIAHVAIFKSNLAGIVAGIIPFLNRVPGKVFIKLYLEFNRSSNIHENNYSRLFGTKQICSNERRYAPFPTPLKRGIPWR